MAIAVVIDDDADDIHFLAEAFGGFDVSTKLITFMDSTMAIRWFENASIVPEYVFIDINMPAMDGPECLQRIRMMNIFADSVIIMISTTMRPEMKEMLKGLGANFAVKKPVTARAYSKLIRDIVTGVLDS